MAYHLSIYIYKVEIFPSSDKWQGAFATRVIYVFFYILGPSSFRSLQFDQILSNHELSNLFRTNYYRMKFDNLFYCSLKFKMNKEINKII